MISLKLLTLARSCLSRLSASQTPHQSLLLADVEETPQLAPIVNCETQLVAVRHYALSIDE
ncbi:MAG: hypothetical protein KTR25_09435 [Myxococcales bacterium]|nr:hypothetical protein [Myxococcales bacterium]